MNAIRPYASFSSVSSGSPKGEQSRRRFLHVSLVSAAGLVAGCRSTTRRGIPVGLLDAGVGATVALWLAEGAVAYLGGKLMEGILGHSDYQDVEAYIRRAVEELKTFIRAELQKQFQENDLRKLASLQDAGKRNLLRFSNAPDNEKTTLAYLLEDADIKTSESMSFAFTFSYSGFNVYATSVSLRLLGFESSWKYFGLRSSLISGRDTVNEAIKVLAQGLADYRKSWQVETRMGDKYFLDSDDIARKGWWVDIDRKPVFIAYTQAGAELGMRVFAERLARERDENIQNFCPTFERILTEWQKTKAELEKLLGA